MLKIDCAKTQYMAKHSWFRLCFFVQMVAQKFQLLASLWLWAYESGALGHFSVAFFFAEKNQLQPTATNKKQFQPILTSYVHLINKKKQPILQRVELASVFSSQRLIF